MIGSSWSLNFLNDFLFIADPECSDRETIAFWFFIFHLPWYAGPAFAATNYISLLSMYSSLLCIDDHLEYSRGDGLLLSLHKSFVRLGGGLAWYICYFSLNLLYCSYNRYFRAVIILYSFLVLQIWHLYLYMLLIPADDYQSLPGFYDILIVSIDRFEAIMITTIIA